MCTGVVFKNLISVQNREMSMVCKAIPSKTNKTTAETDLERTVKRIRQSEEFPSIFKYLVEINQKLSACQDASDASDLANVILNDYALTNKLLKPVNSAYYRLAAGKEGLTAIDMYKGNG